MEEWLRCMPRFTGTTANTYFSRPMRDLTRRRSLQAQPGFPGVGMPMKMHHGDDQYYVLADLIDEPVGKSAGPAAARALRDGRPGMGILQDAGQRSSHFTSKSVLEALALTVVVGDGFCQFLLGRVEKLDFHERVCRSISLNTSPAGDDAISPRSYASTRSSTSRAQAASMS
jgi:hypothetical protein